MGTWGLAPVRDIPGTLRPVPVLPGILRTSRLKKGLHGFGDHSGMGHALNGREPGQRAAEEYPRIGSGAQLGAPIFQQSKIRAVRAGGQEDHIILLQGLQIPNLRVKPEICPRIRKALGKISVKRLKFRVIPQRTAPAALTLKDRYLVTLAAQIEGAGQSHRSRAYYGRPLGERGQRIGCPLLLNLGPEAGALDHSDGHRLLPQDSLPLTGALTWTGTQGVDHHWERQGHGQLLGCCAPAAPARLFQKGAEVQPEGTGKGAGGGFSAVTTCGKGEDFLSLHCFALLSCRKGCGTRLYRTPVRFFPA